MAQVPADVEELPGPGIDLPLDLDGDGVATFGDAYVFNYWLALGGDPAKALVGAKVHDGIIDLSSFFSSAEAALSADALLAEAPPQATTVDAATSAPGAGGEDAGVLLSPCPSAGTLVAPFNQSASPVNAVFCDDTLLEWAEGQAFAGGSLFVARRVQGANGGVTRITGLAYAPDGIAPVSAGQASSIVDGLHSANELAYDASRQELLLTMLREDAQHVGQVKRIGNIHSGTPTVCDEVAPGTIHNPDGLAIVPRNFDCGGTPGDVIVTNNKRFLSSIPPDYGGLRRIFDNVCTPNAAAEDWLHGQDNPASAAIGDFLGQWMYGVYFGEVYERDWVTGVPTKVAVVRSTPVPLPTECSTGTSFAPHAIVNQGALLIHLAFDPYSPSLFATDPGGRIWRIRSTPDAPGVPAAVLFGQGFDEDLRGISFSTTGVLLVSEYGIVSAVDGWRYKFKRGDANGNKTVESPDASFIADWLFLGGPEPTCWDAADVNDDSRINISDSIYLLNYLFSGGPAPPQPFDPAPALGFGADATGDLFGCRQYAADKEVAW